MIDFNPISIFEVQSTPATLSCLFLQEFGFDATQEVVLAEPLAPVQEISIIGAGRSLDFDMALDMRLRVIPQRGFSVGEYPAFAFIHMPVFVGYPTFCLCLDADTLPTVGAGERGCIHSDRRLWLRPRCGDTWSIH